MLDAKIFMFSRSLTKDYRWIYSVDFINEFNRNNILNDYKEFENNKGAFLGVQHLIIRQFHEGIVAYKFLETKDKDQNSRRIYALIGCMFSEFDMEITQILFNYIVTYLYEKFDVLFEIYQRNIPENEENLIKKIEFNIDSVIEYFRRNSSVKLIGNRILELKKQCSTTDFIIKNRNVSLISWENNTPFLLEKKNIDPISKKENTFSVNNQSTIVSAEMSKMNKNRRIHDTSQDMNIRKINGTKEKNFPSTQRINAISENGSISSTRSQYRAVGGDMRKTNENERNYDYPQKDDVAQENDFIETSPKKRKSLLDKLNSFFH